ncbi:prolyl oligopeptidase family serine peptidase [Herbaspirillum rhizosphaerae]|uniref:prolyl oligopeptidase family serine peptidase n=1 Tax=Herbaspirillum rhizosphaerae TaxID=346179 RepID=UPI00067ACB74|nr:prolyl oligopeptidase family serine peptidase [Herbaspirillum rhizosphaerae]
MSLLPSWPSHPDPYLSLETDTPASLAWIAQQNQRTRERWQDAPVFEQIRPRLERAYLPRDLPVTPQREQDYAYDVLVDGDHPRGLWRRMRWDDWRAGAGQWQDLLDIDALGESEGVEWQLIDCQILYPDGDRALVILSPGGSDATVMREFDIDARAFVDNGFSLPHAGNHSASWIDRNTLYVLWDAGDDTQSPLTHCGFPYQARRWSRGTAVQDAAVVFSGEAKDDSVYVWFDPHTQRHEALRGVDFFDQHAYYMDADGQWQAYALPAWVHGGYWNGWLILSLRQEWECQGVSYPGGTLLAVRDKEFLAHDWSSLTVLFSPTDETSAANWQGAKHHLLVSYLNDLQSMVLIHSPLQGADGAWTWTRCDLALPGHAHVTVSAVAPELNDDVYVSLTGYLAPAQYWLADLVAPVAWDHLNARTLIGSDPAPFDASTLDICRRNARSADGTRIPYVVVGARGRLAGETASPCLLTGYGGFGVILEPHHLVGPAIGWLEAGGIYVEAHIRGGGEFGEQWHQAAQRDMRQRCFDDFIAVAEDLIAAGLTTPAQLGIQGASNGGLLVAACMVQRPDLFGAVVCEGALLDMQRYPHLHMGSVWIDEYGDPDDEQEAVTLIAYSPYHRVDAAAAYPPVLFTTSANDDRVHPGHARKMAALMHGQGHRDVWYLEKQDGGHGMLDARQYAQSEALVFSFLQQLLMRRR